MTALIAAPGDVHPGIVRAAIVRPAIVRPVGLQLSRARGFRLHQLSHAVNRLPARRVDRATPFGNPFRHQDIAGLCTVTSDEETAPHAAAAALVRAFRDWLRLDPVGRELALRARAVLRGHNLACWCALDRPCHRSVLLEVANG